MEKGNGENNRKLYVQRPEASDPSGNIVIVNGPTLTARLLVSPITVFIFTGITPPGGNAHHSPSLQNESL
ncbi:MAG: hypothetical protein AAFQ95_14880 [Cyanobacteria bacterium J06621_3]